MSHLTTLADVFGARSATRTEADVQQNLAAFLTLAPLGLASNQVAKVEVQTGDGTRRRIDVEFGRLIIEVKRDLTVANAVAKAELLGGTTSPRTISPPASTTTTKTSPTTLKDHETVTPLHGT